MDLENISSSILESSNIKIRNNLIGNALLQIETSINTDIDTKKLLFYQQFCIYISQKFNYITPILNTINTKLGSNYSSIQYSNISNIIKNIEELPFWIDKKHLTNYIKEVENELFLETFNSTDTQVLSNDIKIVSTDTQVLSTDTQVLSTDTQVLSTDTQVLSNDIKIVSTDTQVLSTDIKIVCKSLADNTNKKSPKYTDGENKFKQLFKESVQLEIKIHDRSLLNKLTTKDYLLLNDKLEYIKSRPQPDQRSTAWYEYRNGMLTASDLYDAVLGSISDRNRIAVNKCNPVSRSKSGGSVACNWGIRYEDIAIMVYETRNQCKVEDYGCIQHPNLTVFGASPDGIVSNTNKEMIGRMLEIKCPYSRVINGKPSKKYYSQIQGQLEVCDLEYCDFLECKFKEYTTMELLMENRNQDSNEWGVIIASYNKELDKKIDIILPRLNMSIDEVIHWIDLEQDKIIADDNLEYVGIYFWELDVYSCILIKRDKELFQKIRPRIIDFWKFVEYHREHGIEDIKSTPKNKTTKNKNDIPSGFICSLDD